MQHAVLGDADAIKRGRDRADPADHRGTFKRTNDHDGNVAERDDRADERHSHEQAAEKQAPQRAPERAFAAPEPDPVTLIYPTMMPSLICSMTKMFALNLCWPSKN